MALTPKERERIIEEERVRFEAKQALWAERCAKHPRRGRWLFWLAAAVLAYALWCHLACGGMRRCHGAWGMEGGKRCPYHGEMAPGQDGVEPGQPIPKQP